MTAAAPSLPPLSALLRSHPLPALLRSHPLDAFSHLPISVMQVVAQLVHADAPGDGALRALALVCKATRDAICAMAPPLADRPLPPRRLDVVGALADMLIESASALWPHRDSLVVCLEPHSSHSYSHSHSYPCWFSATFEPPAWLSTRAALSLPTLSKHTSSRADLVEQLLHDVESVRDGSASFVILHIFAQNALTPADPDDVRWGRSLAVLEGRVACAAAAAAMRALGKPPTTAGAMLLLAATPTAGDAAREGSARQAAAALATALVAATGLLGRAEGRGGRGEVTEIGSDAAYWYGRIDVYRMGDAWPRWQHGVRVGHTGIYIIGGCVSYGWREYVRMDAHGKVDAVAMGWRDTSPRCAASAARARVLLERVRVPAIACIRAMARVVEVTAARRALAAHHRRVL